jgi:hypothetical protein
MTMPDPQQTQSDDPLAQSRSSDGDRVPEEDSEFRVTVRKLELPVRPRGVLAE